jgi:hypothetical protein
MSDIAPIPSRALLGDLRQMILAARQEVARTVDAGLVTLYWHIGQRVRRDILQIKRAEYGKGIVSALGRQLSAEFGRGFDEKSLRHMLRFAEAFSDERIVSALRRQLTWTHFKTLAYVEDDLKREFAVTNTRFARVRRESRSSNRSIWIIT